MRLQLKLYVMYVFSKFNLYFYRRSAEKIAEILKGHSAVCVATDQFCLVTVRRTHIWDDSMRVLRRVDLQKRLKVTFLGKSAIDDGGLCREYLRLLMGALVMQSHLFAGSTSRRVPLHNALAVQKGDFHMVGIIIVLSLTKRWAGPAPTFFSPSVVDYFLEGCNNVKVSIDDIPDYDIREKLIKVSPLYLTNNV